VADRIWGLLGESLPESQAVERYIEGQAEHHRGYDFQTEFCKLLDAHGVAYDERYAWN